MTSINRHALGGSRLLAALGLGLCLSACSAADRLANVGQAPKLSAISDPTAVSGYRPVQMPMPAVQQAVYSPNSLWRSGSRAFFKDQRARVIGDLVTVKVKIDDKAEIENATQRSRSSSETGEANALLGLESKSFVGKVLPKDYNPQAAVDLGSTSSSEGSGSVDRQEEVETTVAAVVTQTLPNGNLVIEGRQEVRVNFEVRELIVAGVVRPEDIESDNTIDSRKIAEARIAYGGRGQISDVQQPRYGQQVLDVLLPF